MKLLNFTDNKPFVTAAVIAAVSIMVNLYLVLKSPAPQAVSEQALSSTLNGNLEGHDSVLGDAEGIELLHNLHENVSRNSEQLSLLVAALSKTTPIPADAEEQAEWEAARELASQERKKDFEEKMVFHLSEDERAVVFHQRWLLNNEIELRQAGEELDRIEQSGIDALAEFEAEK